MKICHASGFTEKAESKMPHNFIIACLYRNSVMKDGKEQVRMFFKLCDKKPNFFNGLLFLGIWVID